MVSNPRAGELRALVVPLEKVKNVDKNGAIKVREGVQKTFFFEIFPKCVYPSTHPRVFVRFGKTKGEIRVENAIFGGFGRVLRGLDLVWESATPPTHIWERSPKKKFFLLLP